jgi:peroxiredoxin
MKTKLQIILAVLLVSCNSNNNGFTITGLTSNIPDSTKIYLTDSSESKIRDSSFVIKNQFQFKGSVDSLTQLTIHTKGYGEYKILWVDNAEIILDATKSNLRNGHVSGSHFQEVNSQYLDLDRLWRKRIDSLNIIMRNTDKNDSISIKKISLNKDSAEQGKHNAIKEFMISNPDFYPGTFYITFLMFDQPKQLTEELFNALSERSKSNMWGKSIRVYLEKSVDLKVGDKVIDFTLPDISGNQISLSSFRGKYLLLEFWASWCGPCRQENPNLLNAYRIYNPKGFEILGITLDERKDVWESTIKSDTLIWTTVSDLRGNMGEVPLTYKANYIPKNFLVDREGKIIDIDIRGSLLEERLDSIFKN